MSADDFKTLKEGLAFVRDHHDRHGDDEGGELEQDPDCFCARCVAVRGLAAVDRIEASAAAMREALEYLDRCGGLGQIKHERIQAALATDAGAGLLERLREVTALRKSDLVALSLEKERAGRAEAHVERLKQSHALVVGEADFAQKRAEKAEAEVEATRAEMQTECNHKTDVIQQLHAEVERLRSDWLGMKQSMEERAEAASLAELKLAQARREERERCAGVALDHLPPEHDMDERTHQRVHRIAAAIRALGDG